MIIGHNAQGNVVLCEAWGETDVPSVALVRSRGELCEWLATEIGDETTARCCLSYLEGHDWCEDVALLCEFELGRLRFTDAFAELSSGEVKP